MQSFAKRGKLLALSVLSALVVHLITTRAAYFINIAKVTMDRRRGVLQFNNFTAKASTSFEIVVKLQFGLVCQMARNTQKHRKDYESCQL